MEDAAPAVGKALYGVPAEALVAVGLVALAALMLTFALPRHTRLPVRLAAVLVAVAALGGHVGARLYARFHGAPPRGRPADVSCYKVKAVPAPTPRPEGRVETLARLVARGAISEVVAERAGRVR